MSDNNYIVALLRKSNINCFDGCAALMLLAALIRNTVHDMVALDGVREGINHPSMLHNFLFIFVTIFKHLFLLLV